ncbi:MULTISPECIES: ATP-binding protein [unclassified Microcoleus]|uniref:ATP-binding protein n=2 Tax=Oscillatoriales TaxID=1150 RepID=UPI002FD5BE3B
MTKDSTMKNNFDEIPSGGIGIKVIGKIADELSYTRTFDSRNCLLIVKKYQPKPSTETYFFKQQIDVLKSLNFLQKQRDSQSDQPLKKISLKVNSDIKAVAQVLEWVDAVFENLPIPETVFCEFKLVSIEGFTNAVRHAHKDLPLATPIDLEITIFPSHLEIKIWDYGKPFDLKSKLQEDLAETSPFAWDELEFTLH